MGITIPATTLWHPPIRVETENLETHKFHLRHAYELAYDCSDDPVTKVGAVLVKRETRAGIDGYWMIGHGVNHVPHEYDVDIGERDLPSLLMEDRAWKMAHTTHAEPTSIMDAKARRYNPRGATMYMPWVPCMPCADEMIEAGIVALISHEAMIARTPERWWADTAKAVEHLMSNGVACSMYQGQIGEVVGVMNGQIWQP